VGMINVVGSNGHTAVVWDVANEEATAIAAAKFNELNRSGHALFETQGGVATAEGQQRVFNREAEEYLAVPAFGGG